MRLKELRKSQQMTQSELASFLNMTQSGICSYETGVRQPDHETLIKIADYFNVSLDYLLERTDNPRFEDRS